MEHALIQLAAAVESQPGPPTAPQRIAVIPVLPGDTVPLPFAQGMAARLGENGNLAIKSGDLTIILQGYVGANLRDPVTLLAGNNDVLDVAALIEATGSDVVIQTAIGGALDAPFVRDDPDLSGNGIFEPFVALGTLGPLAATGTLDDTDPILGEPEIAPRASPTPDLLPALSGILIPPAPGHPPSAADLALAAAEDGVPVAGSFSGSDPDPDDQGKLVFAILTQPAEGSATDNKDGTFSFDPGADFQDLAEGETRDVVFQYTAADPGGLVSAPATVTVTVTGINDAPEAKDLAFAAKEDGPAINGAFAGDDADSDDDQKSLAYAITGQPTEGTLTDNNDGTFTFDPGAAFQDLAEGKARDVTFTYTATDQHGVVSNTATVTVTVTGVNDAPAVQDLALEAQEGGLPVDGNFVGDDADSDDDPSTLTYIITSQPGSGTVINNGDGTFSFDPSDDFIQLRQGEVGTVTFTYTATDSHSAISNTGTVTVTIIGTDNAAPTAEDIKIAAAEDGSAVGAAFVGDDPDKDDDPSTLTYLITTPPDEGTVTNNKDGTFSFDPGADFQDLAGGQTRDVIFKYRSVDSHLAVSQPATVTVTVTGTNDAPVAQDATLTAKEDGAPVSAAFDADDIDSDDDPASLKYAIVAPPAAGQGTVINNNDGTFTFDPGKDFQDLAEGETRDVTFKYTATDQHGAISNEGTVTVTVTGVNDAPVADALAIEAEEDGPIVTAPFDGDDPDDDDSQASLKYLVITPPTAGDGQVTSNPDGIFAYSPGVDFQGLAEGETRVLHFEYVAIDQHGAVSAPAPITVTVTGVNDAPVVQNQALAAKEDGAPVSAAFNGDDTDSDDDQASLKYTIVTPSTPGQGGITNNNDGTFTFNPGTDFQDLAEGETRDVSFQYTATDQDGAVSGEGTVTVTVTGVNDVPTVQDIAIKAEEDGVAVSTAFKGDDTDSDDDTDSLKYAIVTPSASQGTITNNNDGTFTFNPGTDFQDLAAGETMDVTFQYTATDQHGAVSTPALVTITVTGVNDAPVAQDMALKVQEDGPAVISAFEGDDADSDDSPSSLKYAIVSPPAGGALVNNGDGTFSFDPGKDFQSLAQGASKDVTFTYTATDSHSAVSTAATVTITVIGANDAPTAENLAASVKEGNAVTKAFTADDIDSDDSPTTLGYAVVSQPSAGTVTVNPDGTFTFNTGEDFDDLLVGQTRTVTFTYTATDSHGVASAPATVTITVTGANVVPVDPNACIPTADALSKYTYVAGTTGNDTLSPGGNNSLWIQGFDGDDKLTGAGLADLLQGGEGNDTLDGGGGSDAILGGLGNDTIKGGDANDCIGAGAGDDTVDGGASNDNLRGDAGNDIVTGGDGEDTVQGGDGNDKLSGDQGQDIVAGGEGDDTLSGNDGDDKVNGGGGNDQLTGDQGQDILVGEAGNDKMSGGDGDDQLDGGIDNDILIGDTGQDKLDGGDGDDSITGGTGDDKINGGAGSDKLFGEENNDTIDGGTGDDIILGGLGDDTILSGGGSDKVSGDAGNDTITMGAGAGQVTGNQGDDRIDVAGGNHVIFYNGLGDGTDTITGFDGNPVDGQDVLNLDALFDSLEATLGPLDAATRASMVELKTNGGTVDVFIDTDNNDATGPVRIAGLATTDPVTVGADVIVI